MRRAIRSLLLFLLYATVLSPLFPLTHILEKGETVYSVGRKYGASPSEILRANLISSPEALREGTALVVPLKGRERPWNRLYKVRKGDTLYSIARKFKILVKELMEKNALSEKKVIKEGDQLLVGPASLSSRILPAQSVGGSIDHVIEGKGISSKWPATGTLRFLDGRLRGVEIRASYGDYIRSVRKGKVIWIGPYRGFGKVVLVDAAGSIYLYGGNREVFVKVGQEVVPGTKIGRLGAAEEKNKSVFFAVFQDGQPIDTRTAPRG